jgi:hypothetical protein
MNLNTQANTTNDVYTGTQGRPEDVCFPFFMQPKRLEGNFLLNFRKRPLGQLRNSHTSLAKQDKHVCMTTSGKKMELYCFESPYWNSHVTILRNLTCSESLWLKAKKYTDALWTLATCDDWYRLQ